MAGSTSSPTNVPSDNNSICPCSGTDGSTVFSALPAIFTTIGSSVSQVAAAFQQPGNQRLAAQTDLAKAQLMNATTQQIFTELLVAALIISGIWLATRRSG